MDFLGHLDTDFRSLRDAVADALDERVPTCPDWTGADLAFHVARVYRHKTETMRRGEFPDPWPPDLGERPLDALDETYAGLLTEFAAHDPGDPCPTWYAPDQSVGFWIRRMAHETVIHRVDAELAAGRAPSPIPAELAEDGIDEVLTRMLAYSTTAYPDELADHLARCHGETVRVDVPGTSWLITLGPDVVTVVTGEADTDAVLRAEADPVLRWLWRRAGTEAVELDGDRAVIGTLHQLLGAATE